MVQVQLTCVYERDLHNRNGTTFVQKKKIVSKENVPTPAASVAFVRQFLETT
jgi:hypothetical protein